MTTNSATTGDVLSLFGRQHTIVQPSTTCKAEHRAGHWVCVTHGAQFLNNLQASVHEEEFNQRCKVAWYCSKCDQYQPVVVFA